MRCSKSCSKREVHSNTILSQETRKTLNRLLNFIPKATGKKEQKFPKLEKERNHKDQNEKEMKEIIVKINKTKSWFFEKINKMDKPLATLIKKKGRRIKSTKLEIKNERLKDNAEIHRIIIKDYYEQLYGNIMDNLEEMDRLLEKLNI